MAYIIQEKRNKHTYYYLAESARVNGKPRIISKKYLGTADTISNAINEKTNLPKPEYSTILDCGAVLALFDIAERLNIREIIERHVNKRGQGIPIADSILLAAINRAVRPTSKNSFFSWFNKTVLHNCFEKANNKNLSSQGFWNNMSHLDQAAIKLIEDDITKIVVNKYNISTECLLFDNTNFFTYIDTNNPATLAKRGHSKEKRSDLKIIGLSLMVSPDNNIPLFHEVYPGNTNDSKRFSQILPKLKQRYKTLGRGDCNVTLVFDRGNNSDDNIEDILNETPLQFHFVGGLKMNQCKELQEIPLTDFKLLSENFFKGTLAYRTTKKVYGREFTVVMTFNPILYKAQLEGVKSNIDKCALFLKELQSSLLKWSEGKIKKGRKPSVNSVKKQVLSALSTEHMKDLFNYSVQEENGFAMLSYSLNQDGFMKLKRNVLGRSFLFTDHSDWANEHIVGAYRSQYHVEEAFKRMKDTDYLTFRPIFHFTDSKIRVHAFYCILAYLLTSLLKRELEEMSFKMSIPRMLDCFQNVQQVITIFSKSITHDNNFIISYSGLDGIAYSYIQKHNLLRYLNRGTTL